LSFKAFLTRFREEAGGDIGRSLIRSFLGVTGILALDACLGLAVAIVLARSLGVAGIGAYGVGLATGRMFSALLQLGLPRLLSREVNHGTARGAWSLVRGVTQFTFATSLGFTLVFAVVTYLAWPAIAVRLPETYAPAMLGGLVFAPLVALANIVSGGLQGWHMVKTAVVGTTVMTTGAMLVLVIAALTLTPGWLTPGRAVALNAGAQCLALALSATIFLVRTLRRTHGVAPTYNIADWRRSMLRFAAADGLMNAEGHIFSLVLGAFATETQVGLFRIAQRAAGLANLGLMAISRVLSPHLGRSFARGDAAGLQKLLTRGAQAMAGSTLVVLIGFTLLGRELLEVVVGPDFRPAYLPLVVLSLGLFARTFFGPCEVLMVMTNQEGTIVRARAIAITVAIGFAVILLNGNAAVGAAAATAMGQVTMALILSRDARRRLGCRTNALGF